MHHNSITIIILHLILLLSLFNAPIIYSNAKLVRYGGSVYHGLTPEVLLEGGSTLSIDAGTPLFAAMDADELHRMLADALSATVHMADTSEGPRPRGEGDTVGPPYELLLADWRQYITSTLDASKVAVRDGGRSVLVTLAGRPFDLLERLTFIAVVPCLPHSLFDGNTTASGGNGSADGQPRRCIDGNPFLVSRRPLVQADAARWEPAPMLAGKVIVVPLSVDTSRGSTPAADIALERGLRVMDGSSCLHAREALVRSSVWDSGKREYRFVPHRGGLQTLCYAPFPEAVPELRIRVMPAYTVAGPEGVSTDPPQVRSGVEFRGTVYGTLLTEWDRAVLTDKSCRSLTADSGVAVDLFLSGTSRATFVATLPRRGIYQLCYRLDGSGAYVRASTFLVERGNELMIDEADAHVLVDQDVRLLESACVTQLRVEEKGNLNLRHRSLNVSSFVWSGGAISGKGSLICTVEGRITARGDETRRLTVPLHNYGSMSIDVPRLRLEGDGLIHNYGNLTLTVASMGGDGKSSVLSGGRPNAITNHEGGTLLLVAPDQRSFALLTGAFVLSGGTTIVSGRVTMTDVVSGDAAEMVLRAGSEVSVQNGRLGGSIGTGLLSTLTLLDSSTLTSTRIHGGGRVHVPGDGVLLDSVRVDGNVSVLLGGDRLAVKRTAVSVYGTTVFGADTAVSCTWVTFVTNTGLAKLLFDGELSWEVDSSISGNMIVQIGGTAVVHGSRPQVIEDGTISAEPPAGHSLASFFVPPNATLYVLDTTGMLSAMTASNPDATSTITALAPVVAAGDGCSVFTPMAAYLTLGGRLVLRGCAAIPLGGIFGGRVELLAFQSDWDVVSRVVCSRRHGHGLGSSVGAAPLCSHSKLPPSVHTGIALGNAVYARSPASFAVDELTLMSGTMRATDALMVHARSRVVVRSGATLVLREGGRVSTPLLLVEGAMDVPKPYATVIAGNLTVAAGGEVRVAAGAPCQDAFSVEGTVVLPPTASSWQCRPRLDDLVDSEYTTALYRQWGMEHSDFRDRVFGGSMRVDFCPDNLVFSLEEKWMFFMPFGFLDGVVQYTDEFPSRGGMVLGSAVAFITAALIFGALLKRWGASVRDWAEDFRKPPPLNLQLTWYEFSYATMNYVAFFAIYMANAHNILAAFHPGLPLPLPFTAYVSVQAVGILMPHMYMSSGKCVIVSIVVCLWCASSYLFLPSADFYAIRRRGGRLKLVYEAARSAATVLSILSCVFVVPLLSACIDGFACNTLLRNAPSCHHLHGFWTALLSLCAIIAYGVCSPCLILVEIQSTRVDLRLKSSWSIIAFSFELLAMMLWKVFYGNPILCLASNTVSQFIRLLIDSYSYPTAYANVNRLIVDISYYSFLIHLSIAAHVLRVQLGWVSSCTDGETWFYVTFGTAAIASVVSFWRNIYWMRDVQVMSGDMAIDSAQRIIGQLRRRIHDLKNDVFSAANESERETTLNAIARLRIEYLEKQARYSYEAQRILRVFYVGWQNVNRYALTQSPTALPVLDAADLVSSPVSPSSYAGSLLTLEEMESFSCGPALGRGSYGSVHLGILTSGKLVAVKYVGVATGDRSTLDAVAAEVNVLRELHHPNIIRYYGVHTIESTMLVFMEFAVGGSLSSIVRKFTELTEPVMQLYTCQILRGLQYLHSKGVVHRDIKGENILIDGSGVAKLADFGCSKSLANLAHASQAGCGTLVGSPFWMAPEVIRSEAYGTKADIWSVGCTVVEMLNHGEPPWREEFDNVYSAMFYVGSTNNIPKIPDDTSELCKEFLRCCFERDVTKRCSAEALLAHEWLRGTVTRLADPATATSSQ